MNMMTTLKEREGQEKGIGPGWSTFKLIPHLQKQIILDILTCTSTAPFLWDVNHRVEALIAGELADPWPKPLITLKNGKQF